MCNLSKKIYFINAYFAFINEYRTLKLLFVKCWFLFLNNCQFEQLSGYGKKKTRYKIKQLFNLMLSTLVVSGVLDFWSGCVVKAILAYICFISSLEAPIQTCIN